jgi:homoserine O-succinyltransferase/O-acetyltransferase
MFDPAPGRCLRIGLVNNMSDEALKATECQFLGLLDSASANMAVHLSFYTLPGVPRNGLTASHIHSRYSNLEDLWDSHLDGLIVTGREPMTENLADEPYWDSFTKVLGWAQENCHATVFSCLAAHAAILAMDGIPRVKARDKVFGIFESACATHHPLTTGIASRFKLPHSRWNGVREEQLVGCGYKVLTRSMTAGVDTFVKEMKNGLFVFFQGHPEYESDTLLREYRRDVGRYIKGETSRYPSMPRNYFDEATVEPLAAFEEKALSRRNEDMLPELNTILGSQRITNTWRGSAAAIYRNLLGYICAQKVRASVSKRLNAMEESEPILGPRYLPELPLEDMG